MTRHPLFRIMLSLAFCLTLAGPDVAMPCCAGAGGESESASTIASTCCDSCIGEVVVESESFPADDSPQAPMHPSDDCKGCSAVCCAKVTAAPLRPFSGFCTVVVRAAASSFVHIPDSLSLDSPFHPPRISR